MVQLSLFDFLGDALISRIGSLKTLSFSDKAESLPLSAMLDLTDAL